MLPVGICWSITKKMGTNQMLGIVLGLTLVSGQLLNAYAVNASAVIPQWDFGFVKVDMIGYQAQVIPAMLAGFTLVYLEKFFRKVTPAVISMIVVPFCSLLLAVMAAHFVLGPIGWTIGFLDIQLRLCRHHRFPASAVRRCIRLLLCTSGHHRSAPHVQRHRHPAVR